VEFAYYANPFTGGSDAAYSSFNPAYLKSTTPVVSGTTGAAGGIGGGCDSPSATFSFYGYTEECSYFTLHYRGYLFADQTGTFTFQISGADDLVLVWAGANAYSHWTRSNALLDVTYQRLESLPGGTLSRTYAAVAGEYIPMRIVFAQGGGPFGFNIAVTAPDGSVVLSAGSATNKFLVQNSCDGTSAPPFAPLGQEQ
jgi:hypothetical protein